MNIDLHYAWLPKVPMKRIIMHWTAGAYTPNNVDKAAYHFVIDGDGQWHRGVDVALNSGSLKSGYAAHTLNLNTDSIGVSMACMAGATEVPFNAGRYPMTAKQVDSLIAGVALLARSYAIPADRKTILSHAEVQPTLGVAQRQKWDFTRLPPYPDLKGALQIGDWLRQRIEVLARQPGQPPAFPAGSTLRAVRTTRTRTSLAGPETGALPAGTVVSYLEGSSDLVRVLTPAGFEVWALAVDLEMADLPDKEAAAIGASTRATIAAIRKLLDELEQSIGDGQ